MLKAVGNVNNVLGPAVIGMDPADQRAVDDKMIEIDGTKNKSNMGANGELSWFVELFIYVNGSSVLTMILVVKCLSRRVSSHPWCFSCVRQGRSSR